jgi:Predicted alternative thymidylate synthase
MSFDVQSQRYVDFSDKDAIMPKSLVDESHFSREDGIVELDGVDRGEAQDSYEELAEAAFDWYEDMVESGVPKEDARFMLPVGTPVNITMSGNARTMMHVLNLRQTGASQWEVRELSEKIVDHLEDWMPYTGNWWRENGPIRKAP